MKFDTLVLRFRDLVTVDNDTISQHKDVIEKEGEVWWAWWKKGHEVTPRSEFALFCDKAKEDGCTVFLMDSGQQRLYKAICVDVIFSNKCKKASPEPQKTPQYYRGQKYFAWFKFTSIEECDVNEVRKYSYVDVASLFKDEQSDYGQYNDKRVYSIRELIMQERTVWFVRVANDEDLDYEIVLLNASFVQPVNFSKKYYQSSGDTLLWLSDLHFLNNSIDVNKSETKKNLREHIMEGMENAETEDVGGLLITGDITFQSRKEGFELAEEFLADFCRHYDLNSENITICPGNHDFAWVKEELKDKEKPEKISKEYAQAYSDFYEAIYKIKPNDFFSCGKKILLSSGQTIEILALNSLYLQQYSNFEGHGYISDEQLKYAEQEMGWDKKEKNAAIRIVMMHHHYLPTCYIEAIDVARASSVVYDADRLMQWLIGHDVKLLLHGHKHKTFISKVCYPCNTSEKNIDDSCFKEITVIGMGSTCSNGTENKYATIKFSSDKMNINIYKMYADESSKDEICQKIVISL